MGIFFSSNFEPSGYSVKRSDVGVDKRHRRQQALIMPNNNVDAFTSNEQTVFVDVTNGVFHTILCNCATKFRKQSRVDALAMQYLPCKCLNA